METLWYLYEKQMEFRPRWIERYFPAVAERHRLTYGDIEAMSEDQAQATRYLLSEQIMYFEARVRKELARSVTLLPLDKENVSHESDFAIRAKLYREALGDLCSVFGFSNPMQ